jgi:peroxiredoxin
MRQVMSMNINIASSLSEQLEQRKQQGATKAPPEITALRHAETKKLVESGIAERSPHAGDRAPVFTLPDANGQLVNLSALLQQGPVVLTFYRGSWCPYCNIQLRAYQAILPHIITLGATLVAVSPETPDFSVDLVSKANLTFPVLTDLENRVARDYRLVFTLPEPLRPYTANLPQHNGDKSWELPMPGTFIIAPDGLIRLAYVHADYTMRLEPSEILKTLRQLSKEPLDAIP